MEQPHSYELTDEAADDIFSIYLNTREKWGEERATRYAESLKSSFLGVSRGSARMRVLSKERPEIQFTCCEKHHVICEVIEDVPPRVIAVFHERMDIISRLNERLSDIAA